MDLGLTDARVLVSGGSYGIGREIFAVMRSSPLHPGHHVAEGQVRVTPELAAIAKAVRRVFGLDIFGVDLVRSARGWVAVDINDFPGFGGSSKPPLAPYSARWFAVSGRGRASRIRPSACRAWPALSASSTARRRYPGSVGMRSSTKWESG